MRQQFYAWFCLVTLLLTRGAMCQEPQPDSALDPVVVAPADEHQQKFEVRRSELTAQYWAARAAIDDTYVEEAKRKSQQLVQALEEARKKAMPIDSLDDALHFDELKKQYLAWVPEIPSEDVDEPSAATKIPAPPTETKRSKEPSDLLLEQFNKDIKALAAQRTRALVTCCRLVEDDQPCIDLA